LREGEVYFSVQFVDEQMHIPVVGTWVYGGKTFDYEIGEDRLISQDVEFYRQGIRHGTDDESEGELQLQQQKYVNHIFEYERALEVLMNCSLRRMKGRITSGPRSMQ
jgi:hypothetical protein